MTRTTTGLARTAGWIREIPAALQRYHDFPLLRRARYPWNALRHRLRCRMLSEEELARWTERRLGLGSHHWIFIAGCHNSGTSLLRQILAGHPGVRALPREGQVLSHALPSATRLGVPRMFTHRMEDFRWTEDSDPAPALRAKHDWARYFEPRPGHLLMKSPENTVRMRWLQRHFAPARFLLIVRHAHAVCEGTRRRSGHSIEAAARHYAAVHRCMLADRAHLREHMLLRYEDLCADPEAMLRRIQAFLELETPFSADSLRPRKIHNIHGHASAIRNFNPDSDARLTDAERTTIDALTGQVMAELGYGAHSGVRSRRRGFRLEHGR